MFSFDRSMMRSGQQQAFDVAVKRIEDQEDGPTSIVLPTRYGKSDCQRLVQLTLKHDGLVCGTLTLTPSTYLVRQFCSEREALQMAQRYGFPPQESLKIRTAIPEDEWFINGEFCVAMTQQLATFNARIVVQNALQWQRRTGLPVYMTIDECDETVIGRSRGNLVQQWQDAGLPLSMWTAMAVREDGEEVPGFKYDRVETCIAYRTETFQEKQDNGDFKRRINIIAGNRVGIKIRAHHETTFAEAWAETPSSLCKLNRLVVDVELVDDEGKSKGMLSEQSETAARSLIGKAAINDAAISQGVRYLLADMQQNRAADERCTAIVFTGNDNPGVSNEENFHAKKIAQKIHELSHEYGFDKRLKVTVATVKSSAKQEEKIADMIEDFVAGKSDILIVKQAAARGLTAPHLKTMLDLSPVRKARSFVQRMMRVATPFHDIKTATIITLSDCLADDLWREIVQKNNGEGDEADFYQFIDDELVDTKLIDIKDREPDETAEIKSAWLSGFDDNQGLAGNASQYVEVHRLLCAFPFLKRELTMPEIVSRLHEHGIDLAKHEVLKDAPVSIGLNSQIEILHERINEAAKSLAQCISPYQGADAGANENYKKAMIDVFRSAKEHAGVKSSMKLKAIKNVKSLTKMLGYMEARLHDRQAVR